MTFLDNLLQFEQDLESNAKRQLYGNMGVYLYYEDRKEEALVSYLKGLEATKNMPDRPDKIALKAYPLANISEVLIDLGRYDEAAVYLDSLTQLGFDNISQNIQHSLLKYTYRLNAQQGAGPQQMVRLLDSIKYATDRQSEKKFRSEIKALTQANRNQQQLMVKNNAMEVARLKLQTRILWASLIIAILLGLVGFGYRRKLVRMDRFKMQMQQRLLRTQMSPHYTSNSLYAISRIYADKPKEASNLLLKFSRQLRQIMENSAKNSVLLEDEIEALKGYLELQKIHFEQGLSYNFEYQNLDPEDPIYILPMLIQPFVENCIEHGFQDIEYEAKVLIRLEISDQTLICQIEDNGCGLVNDAWARRKNSSTQLITTYLSKTHKNPVTVTNKPSDQGSGTRVTLRIPYTITHD